MDINHFYQQAVGFSPNPLQKDVWEAYQASAGHPALLVRAGTGAGKTEAVLLPALADPITVGRRIILVMPSKALIEDMGERVKGIVEQLAGNAGIRRSLTVDMGGYCRRLRLDGPAPEWVAYHRHLFVDDIIITTLDKLLFRLFGYGERIKSYIFPHRVFGSKLTKRPFVIFDEAHDYETLAFSNFRKLVEALYIKGKDLCVMSATIPASFVDFLTPVDATDGSLGKAQAEFQTRMTGVIGYHKTLDWIDGNGSPKAAPPESRSGAGQLDLFPASPTDSGRMPPDPEPGSAGAETLVSRIAEQVHEHYDPRKRIIVRTEYVSDLVTLSEALESYGPIVYHGRLTMTQRSHAIRRIIQREQAGDGYLVLSTSAIEAGCDLDAHIIITELCNPDSLVQLAGRLNRRGKMKDARLIVVGDRVKPRVANIPAEEMDAYLEALRGMAGRFDPDKLAPFFRAPSGDWMGEILFDMLWEYVYEGNLSNKPLWDRGILVTRSWEPAVTLCTGIHPVSKRPRNPIQVGVSQLARGINLDPDDLKKAPVADRLDVDPDGAPNVTWHADLFKAFYNPGNPEESRWRLRPIKSGQTSCYETSLICRINAPYVRRYFDDTLGYVRIPKILIKAYRQGFKRFLTYRPAVKKDGCFKMEGKYMSHSGRLWFLER